jgi:hypothetical protein
MKGDGKADDPCLFKHEGNEADVALAFEKIEHGALRDVGLEHLWIDHIVREDEILPSGFEEIHVIRWGSEK